MTKYKQEVIPFYDKYFGFNNNFYYSEALINCMAEALEFHIEPYKKEIERMKIDMVLLNKELVKEMDAKDELQVKLKQSLVCSNCGATNIPKNLRIENLALRAELNLRRKSE